MAETYHEQDSFLKDWGDTETVCRATEGHQQQRQQTLGERRTTWMCKEFLMRG